MQEDLVGYQLLALRMFERGGALSSDDVSSRLRSCIRANYAGTSNWAYFSTYIGNSKSGDVIYVMDGGDSYKAPYTLDNSTSGAATCTIAFDKAVKVIGRTIWELETSATESDLNRNVSRDTPDDKNRLTLTESETGLYVAEADANKNYPIRLIAPGKGSTAFYTEEALKSGVKVFKAGTHVFLNHATKAEESARPEGDVSKLAGVLAEDARWEVHPTHGAGLWSSVKPFADHAAVFAEKGPHLGMSIRAYGIAEAGGKQRDGVPVLKEFTAVQSVDVVTKAGAGGLILSESAVVPNPNKGAEMDEAKIKELVESGIKAGIAAAVGPLQVRAVKGDAMVAANRALADYGLSEGQRDYIANVVLARPLPMKDDALDTAVFVEAVKAEAKLFAATFGGARVTGMGVSSNVTPIREAMKTCPACEGGRKDEDGKDCVYCSGTGRVKESRADLKAREDEDISIFESLGMPKEAAAGAARFN